MLPSLYERGSVWLGGGWLSCHLRGGPRGLGPDSEVAAVASEVPGEFCLSEEEEKHRSSTSVQAWHGMSHRCMGLLGGWRTEKSETPSPRAAGVLGRCG